MMDESSLLSHLPKPIAILSERLEVTFANPACARLFGTPLGQSGALTRAMSSFPALRAGLERTGRRVLLSGHSASFRWDDQGIGAVHLVLMVPLGGQSGIAVVFDDVSELARIEAIHAGARRYLEGIFHHLDRGVTVLDPDFRLTFLNTFQAKLLEAAGVSTPLELIGSDAAQTFPIFDADEWGALRERVVDRQETVTRERVPFPPSAPGRFITVTLVPLGATPEAGVGGAVCLTEDVTRVVALEDELVRRERVALVGQLAMSLNHEINNPLTTILGAAETLLRAPGLDDSQRRRLDAIRVSALAIADVAKRVRELQALQEEGRLPPATRRP